MWKRRDKPEWLPWYRASGYKGNLTEEEKRQLDAFRMQPKHPAAVSADLPEEVQNYMSKVELQLYDLKQEQALERAVCVSLIGAALLWLHYTERLSGSPLGYLFDVGLLVIPWGIYRARSTANEDALLPADPYAPPPTDEGIRTEWELMHLTRMVRPAPNGDED